jgi:hypothetical protein
VARVHALPLFLFWVKKKKQFGRGVWRIIVGECRIPSGLDQAVDCFSGICL